MSLPFDGAISAYYREDAPQELRDAIGSTAAKGIATADYPYSERLSRRDYETQMQALQLQLVRLQADVRDSGRRIIVVFEGRDAAGKGGTIKRLTANLNPRVVETVALAKPTETERRQWYFQRYIARLPAEGQITLFDRSWYNRAVVEQVFGFTTHADRERFFAQLPAFEEMLTGEKFTLIKLWLNVGRAEQLRRFLQRESSPLKQWKLSEIDVRGLRKWDEYSRAIAETFERSHFDFAPWTVIRSDDKRRARLEAIRKLLRSLDYEGKDEAAIGAPDPAIIGGPDIWND